MKRHDIYEGETYATYVDGHYVNVDVVKADDARNVVVRNRKTGKLMARTWRTLFPPCAEKQE